MAALQLENTPPPHPSLTSEEARSKDDVPYPVMASHLLEEVTRDIASYAAGEGIEQDYG